MKLIGTIIGGLTGAVLTTWGLVSLYCSTVLPLIPNNEYTGIIKLMVGVGCFLVFGGVGFWVVMVVATFCGICLAAVLPNHKR